MTEDYTMERDAQLDSDPYGAGSPVGNSSELSLAKITVIGVGGGGSNAVNRMIEAGVQGVDFVVANTDLQALCAGDVETKIELKGSTRGLGAGADPKRGREAAEATRDLITETLRGSDMVFVTAGEGGGTGTGAAPVIASIARELGALTVGVVSRPFSFEGARRKRQAEAGIEELRKNVDALIVVPNDSLLAVADPDLTYIEAFKMADDTLRCGVQGITELITTPALVNVDFADVEAVMRNAGTALMGIGVANGDDRAGKATEAAISSKLLESEINGAHGALIFLQASSDLTLQEVNKAVSLVQESLHEEANVIYGTAISDDLGDQLRVTVIAAGFDEPSGEQHATPAAFGTAAPQMSATRVAPAIPDTASFDAEPASSGFPSAASDTPARPAHRAEPVVPTRSSGFPAAAPSTSTPHTPSYETPEPSYANDGFEVPRVFDDEDDDNLDLPDFLRH